MMNYEIFKEGKVQIGGSYGAGTYNGRTHCSHKQPER